MGEEEQDLNLMEEQDLNLTDDINQINNNEDSIDVSETELKNKTLQIQELISHFSYRLLGYILQSNGERLVFEGDSLLGDSSLKRLMLLFHPFSREVIMISDKSNYTWQKQLLRTRFNIRDLLTKATDLDVKDIRDIWRSCCNLLFNIGDIILNKNSHNILEKMFGINNLEKNTLGEKTII